MVLPDNTETGTDIPDTTEEATSAVITSDEPEPTESQTDVQPEPQQLSAPEAFDWSQYKNADHLEGRSVQDVIDYLQRADYERGKLGQEIGPLREKAKQFEKLQQQIQPTQQKQEPEKFTDVEMAMFAHQFNQDPLGAFNKFVTPRLSKQMQENILNGLREQLGPLLQGHLQGFTTEQELRALDEKCPDNMQYRPLMQQLMTEDYVGDKAPFEDVYHLAVLSQKEQSLFPETCKLMRMGIPFKDAKEYAVLKRDASKNAGATKEQVIREVKSATGGLRTDTAQRRAPDGEIKSMEDAFDSSQIKD